MWKKSDKGFSEPFHNPVLQDAMPMRGDGNEKAVIGSSITIKGDLSGEEDLIIQGKVAGTIRLHQYSVTVGRNGQIKADIFAKSIKVDGKVEGNLTGEEQVLIREFGQVQGNITAPKVSMEEGCQFKGSVDMGSVSVKQEKTKAQESQNAPLTKPVNSDMAEKQAGKDSTKPVVQNIHE